MNIIGNNCLHCRIYQAANMKFNNPFCWGLIYLDDFFILINDFNKLNFLNINLTLNKQNEKNTYKYVKCELDNKVNIHFIHYLYNDMSYKLDKKDVDIFYKDIIDWVNKKWITRYNRMNSKPTFFISALYGFQLSSGKIIDNNEINNLLKKFNELGKTNDIILFCDKQYITDDLKNLKIIEYNDEMKEAHNNKNDKLVGKLIYKELQVKYPELINE